MKYKCIIFDCDGVLVDSELISNTTMVNYANELGTNITVEFALREFVGKSLSDWMRFIEKEIGKPLPISFEEEFRKRSFDAFKKDLKAIDGIPELLEKIKIPFCVASSGPSNKIKLNLTTTGLIDKFEGNIFSCYDINKWKPEPDIFLYAAGQMGFKSSECLVIEDSPSGIQAAKKAGMDVIALAHQHSLGKIEKENVPIIYHISEIIELIPDAFNQSMKILENHSLKECNTFGIDINAERFLILKEEGELFELLNHYTGDEIKILGGGSNLLLANEIKGLLIKNEIKGIEVVVEDDDSVLVEVGGGENWHEFVMWAVENNYGGIENLSLIPGTVGAAPIQNIGAYGVELKDVFEGLNAIHFDKREELVFTKEECEFGYRESVFKKALKGKVLISRVYLRLKKKNHVINTSYGAIKNELEKQGIDHPSIKNISDTVIAIRQSKLPDPKELGNSGSFFKNTELSKETFLKLKEKYPNIPSYSLPNNKEKVPTAWLIDQCGFKGVRYGNTGCFKNQPLVLVNYGNATGKEILEFSEKVQKVVLDKFGVRIYPEVNIW